MIDYQLKLSPLSLPWKRGMGQKFQASNQDLIFLLTSHPEFIQKALQELPC